MTVARVSRRFDQRLALNNVSLSVDAGRIHALLGPNGAGKTTLLRILCGLIDPTDGTVSISDMPPAQARSVIGFVPPGERTFYMRLSAMENLLFFARLHGMRRREARTKAEVLLARVDLADAAAQRVGTFSQGMLKRLAVARALLSAPAVLLIDEATHDLDPAGARRIRELARGAADDGAAVLWATQRVEEIRGFADGVTVLVEGGVRFAGTVAELLARAGSTRYLLELADGRRSPSAIARSLTKAVAGLGSIAASGDAHNGHYVLALGEGASLGTALQSIMAARFQILACREETSAVEDAFLTLTEGTTR